VSIDTTIHLRLVASRDFKSDIPVEAQVYAWLCDLAVPLRDMILTLAKRTAEGDVG